ncbi:MAG: LptF/LptG family permease [Syntrophobacterales bacterium]|nr:LptF/LptG family permease [Syntrophobacterales bacterium]
MERLPARRPRLLEAYVAREYAQMLALCLAALVSVFLVVDFFEKIDRLVRAGLGVWDFGLYGLLKFPFALEQVLPPAVLVATLLTFGLMARFQETLAMRTAGLDILALTRPVLGLAALTAVLQMALILYLVPWSQTHFNEFWEGRVQKNPARSLLRLERLWYKGDGAIYNILVFHKGERILEGVTVYFFDPQFRLTRVVTAKRAVFEGGSWHFQEGTSQDLEPQGPGTLETFGRRTFQLTEKPEDFGALEKKVGEMDLGELSRYIARLERDGYRSTPYRAEFHSRLSLGLAPLILALLGLGLVLRYESWYLPILVALGLSLMFLYWLAAGLGTSLAQAGRLPPLLATWLPHLSFALLAGLFLRDAKR